MAKDIYSFKLSFGLEFATQDYCLVTIRYQLDICQVSTKTLLLLTDNVNVEKMDSSSDSIFNQLQVLIRKRSLYALEVMSKNSNLQVQEVSADNKVKGHWMSVISVSGEQIHITLRVQFNIEAAQFLSQESTGLSNDNSTMSQHKDFIREFCNMLAGYTKNILINNSISVAVSLPILCRGFDNYFFDFNKQPSTQQDEWIIAYEKFRVDCSSVIEIYDTLRINHLTNEDTEIGGEVEFL